MTDRHPKLLPRLGPNAPNPDDESDWHRHDGGLNTLSRYADSLEVGGVDAPPEQLKSVPTPWARLVVFEHALFESDHPVHEAVVQEWRGLLGCFALHEYERFDVTATGLDLDGADALLRDLREMLESPEDARWDRLGLINVQDALVGGTSPRTLVFTGIRSEAEHTPVPWQDGGRFRDPAQHYYELEDRLGLALLHGWLDEVVGRLRGNDALDDLLGARPSSDVAAAPQRAAEVLSELDTWQEQVAAMLEEFGGAGEDDAFDARKMWNRNAPLARAFHSGTVPHDVYSVLVPAPFEGQRSNDLRLRNEDVVLDPGDSGIIVEADTGQPFTGTVRLASGGTREVREGRLTVDVTQDQLGENVVDPGTHYTESLVQVEAVVRGNVKVLEGEVDYLYPFRTDLVERLGPGEVARAEIVEERSGGVKVRLELPLERPDLHIRYDRVYQRGDVVDGYASPELAIWPDFVGPAWEHYFYYTRPLVREGADELEISPALLETVEHYQGPEERRSWGETRRPVRAWEARAHRTQGLLFTDVAGALARVDNPRHEWDVSVDFGSTHTRVYRSRSTQEGEVEPEPVDFNPRAVPLLQGPGSLPVSFFPSPDNEVGSRREPRSLVQLPLEKIPSGRGKGGFPADWLPADGIVYWRSLLGYRIPEGLRTNLKWHERDSDDAWAFQSYLTQLYLITAAEAAAADQPAEIGSITPAFPSVFTEDLRKRHQALWKEIGEQFGHEEDDIRPSMMESVALAQYLTHGSGDAVPAANLLAVDVGGSTADMAVWSGSNRQIESDSVRMAGGLMTRLVGTDQALRDAVSQAAAGPGIRRGADLEWTGDRIQDGLRFAALLRYVEREEGSTRPLADNLYTGRGSEGERVIAHAGYLYAVLSYLMGMMVRRAGVQSDTYRMHFGGHGSGYLPWLDTLGSGTKRRLPETFFLAALRPEDDVQVQVSLSAENAKEEVGQGILLASEEAWELNRRISDHRHRTFLGESGLPGPDAQPLSWSSELKAETLGEMTEPERPLPLDSYEHLMRFLRPFREGDPPLDAIGEALGLSGDILNEDLRDTLHQRLYGANSAWSRWQVFMRKKEEASRGGGGLDRPDLLLEPFFVVEARTLLEHVTGNSELFGA